MTFINFILVNWVCSSALRFSNYKSKDSNCEKFKYYRLLRKIQKFSHNKRSSFEPMDLIAMADMYVLLTGVLGKENIYDLPGIPIPDNRLEKIKQKYVTAKNVKNRYKKSTQKT